MIKEIEVGGVKHSITLADDMVGSGLIRGENGTVCIKIPGMIPHGNPFMSGIVVNSGFGLCLDRYVISQGLLGTGLEAEGGRLKISTTGLAHDLMFVSGLANGLAGTGLYVSDGKLVANVNTLCGTGLFASGNKLSINSGIAGSGLAYVPGDTPKMEVCINTSSGLGYDFTGTPSVIYVKIARRASGLRLILNHNGELDVTQD